MAKGYWICFYRSISNPDAVAEYAKLAGPAIQSGGGRFRKAVAELRVRGRNRRQHDVAHPRFGNTVAGEFRAADAIHENSGTDRIKTVVAENLQAIFCRAGDGEAFLDASTKIHDTRAGGSGV